MALGGFENGVTTLEMAAAYSAFVNDGIYTTPQDLFAGGGLQRAMLLSIITRSPMWP